jgi:TatD DNase family protein
MIDLVDTHAHLTDERFGTDVEEVLTRARAASISWVVTIASDLEDAERTVGLARSNPGVFATVGIHPHAASTASDEVYRRIQSLAADPWVVALGETGLDFHYDNSPRADQLACFERHLEIAREMDLPVVVHARDADDEVRGVIRNARWNRGVLHCFSGGRALLDDACRSAGTSLSRG